MTPERANEILNTESKVMPGFKLINVGKIRRVMTFDEIDHTNAVWDTMQGSASFHSALTKIANTEIYPPMHTV